MILPVSLKFGTVNRKMCIRDSLKRGNAYLRLNNSNNQGENKHQDADQPLPLEGELHMIV